MTLPFETLTCIEIIRHQEIETVDGDAFYNWQRQKIPVYPPTLFT